MPRRVRPFKAIRVGMKDLAFAEDGGDPVHIRSYDPVGDRFKYTAAGRLWLQNHGVEMVPLLPVVVQNVRKSCATVSYHGWYPISNLPQDIVRALLRAQNTGEGQAAVKQRVLTRLKDNGIGELQMEKILLL